MPPQIPSLPVAPHLGYFATAVEAAKAYNEAALSYFGEFARLNPV